MLRPAVFLTLIASPAVAADPSFDCSKAESGAEKAICASDALAELDLEVTRLYKLAVATPDMGDDRLNELKAMQRGWIKGRDECWKSDLGLETCVANEYGFRIMDLRQGYANARSADDDGISMGPMVLACDGLDAMVGITFVNGSEPLAVMRWQENAIVLPRVPSASGAKYETDMWYGGPSSLFTKGDEALFTPPGGAEVTCKIEEIG
ncbi:MliC family protein [Lutimaribacter marinistellae]|uniref:MliC family protein n=1 Tax=Lutimaribacter marinistellae TaxID=1820329 RepID=A0ABV7TMY1_9RHOB